MFRNLEKKSAPFFGRIDHFDGQFIKGWAANKISPDSQVSIQVFEGGEMVEEFSPSIFRWDLKNQEYGNGCRGFIYQVPAQYVNGGNYTLHFKLKDNGEELENSPVTISDSEEAQYIPFSTTSLLNNKVLALAPHPDDESLGCGGSLILHRKNKDQVKIVFLTDGSKADAKGEYDAEEYVSLREEEARKAARLLGVSDIEFWKIPDRSLSVDEKTLRRLGDLLNDYKPTLIYAPSPLEFHPDHRVAAALIWQAMQKTQARANVAFYEYNRPICVNALVDITQVIDEKKRACDSYESQIANYPYTDCALGLNRYRALTVSPFCDYVEGYFLLNNREILSRPIESFLLEQFAPVLKQEGGHLPLVSIIIRTRDRMELLREALSSALTQTYPNLEVVVVNDGGGDVTPVIREFEKYVAIDYLSHESSMGRAAAANAGMKMARGKYVNFLDDDDILHPDHIEKLALFLEKSGEQAAYSDCEIGHYRWTGKDFALEKEKHIFMGFDFDRDRLYFTNFIPIMTAMFAREIYERAGPFDESLEFLEDWDFWIRASDHATFQRLPGVTAEYRVFSSRVYDENYWKAKVYEKYQQYWTPEILAKSVWPRIEALENENAKLRNQIVQNEVVTSSLGGRLLNRYGRIKHRYLLPIYRRLRLTRSKPIPGKDLAR